MKRGVCIFVVLLFIFSSISVVAEPSVSIGPLSAYETNAIDLSLNVSNYGNDYAIDEVLLDVSGFVIASMANYFGWTEIFNGSYASWTDGSLGTNVMLAVFELVAAAPQVDEDSTYETTITIVDSENEEHEFDFNFTIFNDITPPQLHDIVPSDGDFVKEGIQNQPLRVNATDPETGIQTVDFSWILCNFQGNETPEEHNAQLALEEGLYQADIDLSEYENEQQICFDFTAYNNGGERTEYEGTLTVDGVPPIVSLLSPNDGAIVGLADTFSFQAEDNLATTLMCSMDIDGTEYITDIEAENMQAVTINSADVEEGQHTWSMRCLDPAGWEGQSTTQTYTLDKTPPTIVMTAPENNSIIADSTELEFEVTDNNQLEKVWIVKDGNETEVNGVFSIDVSNWQEGPSEFAVRAEDSVGNQAEQTYQIIVDRTSPSITLVSPDDNATSDVHVEIIYSVLDNYDDEMDCSIYVDDEGREEHVAQAGSNTSQTEILAIGEHRWRVQCVDDAGNTASTDERQLTVIDLSGPDIVMDNPDTVYRGDLLQLSLEVTDISGVESVTAELRDPDDNIQAVPLENTADTYTATIDTTIDSTLGTYILTVYAVDTLNNSNTLDDSILVTYRYVIALDVTSSVSPSASVDVIGVVLYDNGSLVPEDIVSLTLPGDVLVNVSVDDVGEFSHVFNAPSSAGTYSVVTSVLSSGNGETYTKSADFNVFAPNTGGNGGTGGSGSGSSDRVMVGGAEDSGSCVSDWQCTAWTMCEDGKQEKVCVDMSGCSDDDSRRTETRTCTAKEEDDNDTIGKGNTINATRTMLPGPEKHTVDTSEENTGTAAGIGKASGFMSKLNLNIMNIIFALLLMSLVMGALYKYGWEKGDRRKKKVAADFLSTKGDKLGLEDYINSRANRRFKI